MASGLPNLRTKAKRAFYLLNVVFACLSCGALGVLLLAPQVVERQVGERLESVLEERALGRAEPRIVPDLRGVEQWLSQSKLGQKLRAGAVAQYAEREYSRLMQALLRDLQIFATTDLALFALAAVAIRREHAQRTTTVLSLVLTASALAGTWCYVYGQNWLEAVLFSNYYGYGYVAFVGVIAAILCDIALNEARVLLLIVEALAEAPAHFH